MSKVFSYITSHVAMTIVSTNMLILAGCGGGASSGSVTAQSAPLLVATSPRVASISGVANTNQIMQLVAENGKSFGLKSTTAPIYWNKFEAEIIGEKPIDQEYGLAGGKPFALLTIADTSRGNGTKTISYRYSTTGSEVWGRNYIDLGPQNNIYATMWVKISKTGTTSTSWNWKGEYISSDQLDYNGSVPHTTVTKINFWDEALGRWYNPSYYIAPSGSPSGAPSNQHLFDTWERIEYWIKRNSSPGAADGVVYINRIGLASPIELKTNVVTHNSLFNETWRYLNLGQGVTSNFTGTIDITVSYDDVYVDTSPARVELCDSPTWAGRAHCEIQPITTWSASNISFTFNQGSFLTGQTCYLYVVDVNGVYDTNGYAVVTGNSY
jgi:hypothetical protein